MSEDDAIRTMVDKIILDAGAVPLPDLTKKELLRGSGNPDAGDHKKLRPDGQQEDYVVLSEEERKRGFVRPVRHSYVHVGDAPKNPLRDLTPEEREEYAAYGYDKYEEYPPGKSAVVGRYWTAAELSRAGCYSMTTMSLPLAETYARCPTFYGGTFCATCRQHFPLREFRWFGTDEVLGS